MTKKTTKTSKTAKTTPAKTPASKMQMARLVLSALSQELRAKNPTEPTNRLLLDYYAKQHGTTAFDTFDGWRNRGRTVKRGERACTVWKRAEDGGKAKWLVEFLFAETQTTEARPAAGIATA